MTDFNPDNVSYGYTCFPLDEECPQCGGEMASTGYLDWCMNDACAYSRNPVEAPLDSQNDDPDKE